MNSMEFLISETAKNHLIKALQKRGSGLGIRVGVKTKGCSGLAYVLEYVDEVRAQDLAVPVDAHCTVYLDPKAVPYLKGTTMDYLKKGLSEGFEFINPNEKARCGCGESFTV